jgi:conjugal transfer pilus assembly protein TraV
MNKYLSITLSLLTLGGCSTLSGYDAKSAFACRAPDGVRCESMSGVYANAKAGGTMNKTPVGEKAKGVMTVPISSGTPIRTPPRILRVWFAPWEDSDGDLHDQHYAYLPVDHGRWVMEHTQQTIEDQYRPLQAPVARASSTATKRSASDTVPAEPQADVRQDRPSVEQAAQWLSGIASPQGGNHVD